MTFQKQMEALVNEQVAQALARIVLKTLEPRLNEQYGTVVSELVAIRKRNEQVDINATKLYKKLVDLEQKIDDEIEAQKSLRQLERDTLTKLNKYIDHWV